METTPEADCWLSVHVEALPSPISGLGLFATSEIAEGEVVSRLGGRIVSDSALRELIASAGDEYVDSVSVFEDANLVLPAGTANHCGNHSCEPTLWWVDPFSLAARARVPAGAELTVDYGTLTDDPQFRMDCACRTPGCRGVVTGVDWARPDLQERYGDHWVPVLRRRIQHAGPPR